MKPTSQKYLELRTGTVRCTGSTFVSGFYATYAQETCRGTVRIPNREERGERRHILPAQSSTLIVFYDSIIATDRASRCPAQEALPHNKEK